MTSLAIPPLTPGRLASELNADPVVWVPLVLVSVGYFWALFRAVREPLARVGRATAFVAAVASVAAVCLGGLGSYDRTLLWPWAAELIVLATVTPLLLVLARAHTVLGALPGYALITAPVSRSPVGRVLRLPVLATLLPVVVQVATFLSPWLELSLRSRAAHELTRAVFLGVGLMFAQVLLSDRGESRFPYPLRAAIALADGLLDALPGIVVLSAGDLLTGRYFTDHPRSWGPSPQHDQVIAGTLMVALSELVGLPLLFVLLVAWVRSDEREARAVDLELDARMPLRPDGTDEVFSKPWWEDDPRMQGRLRKR